MTYNQPDRLVDRTNVERLIRQAQSNRVQFIRENFKPALWSAGSVGLLLILAVTLLSLSGTNRHVTLAGTGQQMERHTATSDLRK
jgi:hypothetical protein